MKANKNMVANQGSGEGQSRSPIRDFWRKGAVALCTALVKRELPLYEKKQSGKPTDIEGVANLLRRIHEYASDDIFTLDELLSAMGGAEKAGYGCKFSVKKDRF